MLCDDADGLAQRAADILARAGYRDLSYLEGGVAAWAAAGFELFSGVNVPSKAFGEFVEHACDTPNIGPEELHRLIQDGADIVVLDSRPFDEYRRVSIPTATNVPGAELVLRVRDLAPSPDTLVVVNCAGRTRSIIGAQSLINAGVPNKVVALRNGTMGFNLAGFSTDSGKHNRPRRLSAESLAWAKDAAARVAKRYGIERIDANTLDRWFVDRRRARSTFRRARPGRICCRARPRRDLGAGRATRAGDRPICRHARCAPRAGRRRRGTRGDDRVLAQADGLEGRIRFPIWPRARRLRDGARPRSLAPSHRRNRRSTARSWRRSVARDEATVIDLSLSPNYRSEHIPGAWFAIRSRLAHALPKIPLRGEIVLTSEDGVLAGLAVPEAQALTRHRVRYLKGGNTAWRLARHAMSGKPLMADDPVDVWLKPYERAGDTKGAMSEYLSWEVDLVARIERDGTCNFTTRQD